MTNKWLNPLRVRPGGVSAQAQLGCLTFRLLQLARSLSAYLPRAPAGGAPASTEGLSSSSSSGPCRQGAMCFHALPTHSVTQPFRGASRGLPNEKEAILQPCTQVRGVPASIRVITAPVGHWLRLEHVGGPAAREEHAHRSILLSPGGCHPPAPFPHFKAAVFRQMAWVTKIENGYSSLINQRSPHWLQRHAGPRAPPSCAGSHHWPSGSPGQRPPLGDRVSIQHGNITRHCS